MEEKAMCSEGSGGDQRTHMAGDRGELNPQGEEECTGRKGMWWGRWGQASPEGRAKICPCRRVHLGARGKAMEDLKHTWVGNKAPLLSAELLKTN